MALMHVSSKFLKIGVCSHSAGLVLAFDPVLEELRSISEQYSNTNELDLTSSLSTF